MYNCKPCNYETNDRCNFYRHKKVEIISIC